MIHSHSVTAEHLHDHRSLKVSTYAILFIGTPQQGVDSEFPELALNVASVVVSTNKHYYKFLKRDSLWLQEQAERYLSISMKFKTICFYETKETPTKGGHTKLVSSERLGMGDKKGLTNTDCSKKLRYSPRRGEQRGHRNEQRPSGSREVQKRQRQRLHTIFLCNR